MNEVESLKIKNEFNEKVNEMCINDNKEYELKITLIFSLFLLSFIFSLITAGIVYRQYKKYNIDNSYNKEVVNVNVVEVEGNE